MGFRFYNPPAPDMKDKPSRCICNGFGYSKLGTGKKMPCKVHPLTITAYDAEKKRARNRKYTATARQRRREAMVPKALREAEANAEAHGIPSMLDKGTES